jgi:hypothetical protein
VVVVLIKQATRARQTMKHLAHLGQLDRQCDVIIIFCQRAIQHIGCLDPGGQFPSSSSSSKLFISPMRFSIS